VKAGEDVQQGGKAPGLSPEAQLVRSASFILPVEANFEERALDAVKHREGEPTSPYREASMNRPSCLLQ